MENMDNIVKAHIEEYGKDFILSEVEDIKCDFLPDTWEELFDDESEAYNDLCDNEAEIEIYTSHAQDVLGNDASSKQIHLFVNEMLHQLGNN